MSELSVGQLKGLPVNSNVITVPAGNVLYAPGHVLQVVQGTVSPNVSTTSTSFVTSNLSVSITPKSATSKFLITLANDYWVAAGNLAMATIFRNSTNLGGVNGLSFVGAPSSQVECGLSMTVLDSPATTSAITYGSYFRSYGGGTVYAQNGNIPATITVMEIAA